MFRRAIRRLLNTVLGLVVLAPVLALLPAAVLDSGPAPEYRTRFSLFPLALASLDPLLWTCLWNSVAVALVVAVVSLVIGVVLGGMIARSRFLGRPLLEALITAPAVIPPAFFAWDCSDYSVQRGREILAACSIRVCEHRRTPPVFGLGWSGHGLHQSLGSPWWF